MHTPLGLESRPIKLSADVVRTPTVYIDMFTCGNKVDTQK